MVDAQRIETESIPEPVPREPLPNASRRGVCKIGEVRLPIAGPYRPRARLYRYPDGRLVWLVRLWNVDRAVPRLVSTAVLREYARANRLALLRSEIDLLVEKARTRRDRR